MAEISFTHKSLVDGVDPCGTSVFQRYENAIDQLCHDASRVTAGTILDADTVSGAGITAGKHVWTTTSAAGDDGNGGQPPAPKNEYLRGGDGAITTNLDIGLATKGRGAIVVCWGWDSAGIIYSASYQVATKILNGGGSDFYTALISRVGNSSVTIAFSNVGGYLIITFGSTSGAVQFVNILGGW